MVDQLSTENTRLPTESLKAVPFVVLAIGFQGDDNAPGCRLTTPDEKTILSLFAAAQAENHPRLETLLADLLGQPPQPPFAAAASLIAQTFEMNGLILRGPTP